MKRSREKIIGRLKKIALITIFLASLIGIIWCIRYDTSDYLSRDDKAEEFCLEIKKAGHLLPPDDNIKVYSVKIIRDGAMILTLTDMDGVKSVCEMTNYFEILEINPAGVTPRTMLIFMTACCIISAVVFISIICNDRKAERT